jgi:hypothetical protein
VSSAPTAPTEQASHMKKRAVLLLLHLILQMGSMLTALKTVKLLGLNPASTSSLLTPKEYHEYFKLFVGLKPSIGLNPCLHTKRTYALTAWSFQWPNFSYTQSLQSGSSSANGQDGRKSGKHAQRNLFRGFRGRGRGGFIPLGHRRGKKQRGQDASGAGGEEGQAQAVNVSIATDGVFLYLHSSDYGLAKIGSGYANTRRGHVYTHATEFGKDHTSNHLAYVGGFLYYRSERTGANVIKLHPESLEQVEEISLKKVSNVHVHPDSPLMACHRYLYVIAAYTAPTAAVAPVPAEVSLSLHAESTSTALTTTGTTSGNSSSSAPAPKKIPSFEVLTLDPARGCQVISRVVLRNSALGHPTEENGAAGTGVLAQDGKASQSTVLAQRTGETCGSCERFHTLDTFYQSDSRIWCSVCHSRGFRVGSNIRVRNVDRGKKSEFPSWYRPAVSGSGPSARFSHTAVLVRGKRIKGEKDEQEDAGGKDGGQEEEEESKEEKKDSSSSSSTALIDTVEKDSEDVPNIWLFGGGSGRPLAYNGAPQTIDMVYSDLYVYNADTNEWSQPGDITGDIPSGRMGHSCTVVGKKLFILFGGKIGEESHHVSIIDL